MRLTGVWVVVVMVLGCAGCDSGGGYPQLPWESGSRVRAWLAVTEDGFAVRTGWRDTERGLDCLSFLTAEAIPPVCGAVRGSEMLFFADEQCSQPAVWSDVGDVSQGYAVRMEAGELHLYRIPTEVPVPNSYQQVGDYCEPGTLEVFPILQELPLGTLVTWREWTGLGSGVVAMKTSDGARDVLSVNDGTRTIADSPTRLRLVTNDNGEVRAVVGVFDSTLDIECGLASTIDGLRCVPPQAFPPPLTLYRDDLCQQAVSVLPAPGFDRTSEGGLVAGVDEYATLDPGSFYARSSSGCVVDTTAEHYVGVNVPLSSFQALSTIVE